MDISKLKLEKYEHVKIVNFPEEFDMNTESVDNGAIMVYRKDGVNRDSIMLAFGEETYDNFKIRRPALCSLSKELSAVVQSYEG